MHCGNVFIMQVSNVQRVEKGRTTVIGTHCDASVPIRVWWCQRNPLETGTGYKVHLDIGISTGIKMSYMYRLNRLTSYYSDVIYIRMLKRIILFGCCWLTMLACWESEHSNGVSSRDFIQVYCDMVPAARFEAISGHGLYEKTRRYARAEEMPT
jgi:hypothetical protein